MGRMGDEARGAIHRSAMDVFVVGACLLAGIRLQPSASQHGMGTLIAVPPPKPFCKPFVRNSAVYLHILTCTGLVAGFPGGSKGR